MFIIPEEQSSPFETLLQNLVGTAVPQLMQKKKSQKVQGLLSDLTDQSSPLDVIKKISSLPVDVAEKKALLDAYSHTAARSEKEITPYQKELIRQREAEQGLQEKRIEESAIKRKSELPKSISAYTNLYTKELGITPEDKVTLDSYVRQRFEEGESMDDALQEGIEALQARDEYLSNLEIPSSPWFGKDTAKLQAAEKIGEAIQIGIADVKKFKELLSSNGWSEKDQTEILQMVGISPQETLKGNKKKTKLKPADRQMAARNLLEEAGGDKTKAMELFMERYE